MSTLRPIDMKAEKALADFMDTFFYPRLKEKNGESITHKRITDKQEQLRGIDVILKVGGDKIYRIDEKASLHYGNCMLPTFAFELSSIQSGNDKPIEGWLTRDDLDTDFYLLIWPNIKCVKDEATKKYLRKELNELTKYDFTIIEAMFIKKGRLLNHLGSLGLTKDILRNKAAELRTDITTDRPQDKTKYLKFVEENGFEYCYTGSLKEKPINILIKRDVLLSLAEGQVYLVAEDGCARIQNQASVIGNR